MQISDRICSCIFKCVCFSEHQGDILVRWQNGSQTLNALLIKRQTRARVVITAQYHLAIRKLRTSDTAAYRYRQSGFFFF